MGASRGRNAVPIILIQSRLQKSQAGLLPALILTNRKYRKNTDDVASARA